MTSPLVRQDIWKLEESGPWHPVTLAYARAIRVMQERAASDPTSWVYQASVHEIPREENPGDTEDPWRGQCQHQSWFFLPWHRLYLAYFERILRSIVKDLPDAPADVRDGWALPYWDYARGGPTDGLPPAFRTPQLPDGSDNPLFIPARDDHINQGWGLPPQAVSAQRAMQETEFFEPAGRPSGFGGSMTSWHHAGAGGVPGALEMTPHNIVHGLVGGSDANDEPGFMGSFDRAPLDPIFWLHHCNIDRLWVVWRSQGKDPSEITWLDKDFYFHDEAGTPVKVAPRDAVDTIANLGYTYENLAPLAVETRRIQRMSARARGDEPPELAGATDRSVELTGRHLDVAFPLEVPARIQERRAGPSDSATPPTRIFLKVEEIQGDRNPGIGYAVYVNPPDDPSEADAYYAGNVSFFGIEVASDTRRDHPGGHGLQFAFDVTDVVEQLESEGRWDLNNVTVSFVPLRPVPPPGVEARESVQERTAAVRIGRVSFFYQ